MPPDHLVLGSAGSMDQVRRGVLAAVASDCPILIMGASGTGKGVLARFVHHASGRGAGSFVRLNCPAIPGSLFESELFGYARTAFGGAYSSKPGAVQHARGGSLFFDEVADLDEHAQAKLLQFFEDGRFNRPGGREEVCSDVRVICATGRDLEKRLSSGAFLGELHSRISGIVVEMPPLRERQADILPLAEYFAKLYEQKFAHKVPPFSHRIQKLLLHYDWPGHIRQLENIIRRFVVVGDEESIVEDLRGDGSPLALTVLPGSESLSLKQKTRMAVRELERKLILESLEAHNWNPKEAAQHLKISYRSLHLKLRQAGVAPKRGPATQAARGISGLGLAGRQASEAVE